MTAKKVTSDFKEVTRNKKAYHDFDIFDKYEAGMSLTGSEIKSLRAGGISLKEGYVKLKDGDAWLVGVHIAPYKNATADTGHSPFRQRRLLLHRREIDSIAGRVQRRGLTIVPLRVYIKKNHAKIEIGLAKSKKQYDKRQDIIKRETDREIGRRLKSNAQDKD